MQELRRRMSSAKAWGIDGVALLTPARGEGARAVHRGVGDRRRLLHAGVGIVDSLRFGTICASGRRSSARCTVFANTEVLGIDVAGGRVARVRTTRGDIETETIVVVLRRLEPEDRARWPARRSR